jgi:hypothetical protein
VGPRPVFPNRGVLVLGRREAAELSS